MNEHSGHNSFLNERGFVHEEEGVLADVLADIDWIRDSKNVSRRELADRLGVSEARVSRIFSTNGTNLTLRTVARLFFALGERLKVTSSQLEILRHQAAVGSHWDTSGEALDVEPASPWALAYPSNLRPGKMRVKLRVSEGSHCGCNEHELKVA